MRYMYKHNNRTYVFDDRSAEFFISCDGKVEMKTLVSAVKFNLHDDRIKNIEHGLTQISTLIGARDEEPIKKLIDMCKEERR